MDIETLEHREIRRKQIGVGILFSATILLSLILASWMGLWGLGHQRSLYIRFNFAGGIDKGSPVRLAGIRVGRVTEIDFDRNNEGVLRIKIDVQNKALKEITDDSSFYINLAGLIGERYIEIVPGKGQALKGGEELRGVDPPRVDQLLSQGYGIFGDLRSFFSENRSELKEMLGTLNSVSKNLSQWMGSSSPEQRRQFSMALSNLAALSSDLRVSMGLVKEALIFAQQNGGAVTWKHLSSLIQKTDRIDLQDIRRLMMEDGIKVNFSSKKIPKEIEKMEK